MRNLIAYGIAAYLLFEVIKSQYNAITYSVKETRVIEWGITSVKIQFDVNLNNGSDIPLAVDGFIGKVWKGTQKLADVGLVKPVSIGKGSAGIITLGVEIEYVGVGLSVMEYLKEKNGNVTIKGFLYAGKKEIPVKFNTSLW